MEAIRAPIEDHKETILTIKIRYKTIRKWWKPLDDDKRPLENVGIILINNKNLLGNGRNLLENYINH